MTLLQIHEPGQTPLPHAGGLAVGIDLGTTHSVVAVAGDGKADVLRDTCGGALVPSVVYYGEDGIAEVGKRARARLQEGQGQAVASIKRLMGRGRGDAQALGYPYPLAGDEKGDEKAMVRLQLGKRLLTPVEISADILRHMKALAESALGGQVTQAVITVPAYFDDAARQATKDAAKLAGLEVLRLINEPTAAALAYGLDNNAEGIYAVYDLGGGTFDISILKLEKGVFQVLATGGDIALGGDDFDREIAFRIQDSGFRGQGSGVGGRGAGVRGVALHPESRILNPQLLARARTLKEELSGAEEATLEYKGKKLRITRVEFEAFIAPLIEKTLRICAQALEDARLNASDVQGVVLVGGSTRIPFVQKRVAGFFGKEPLANINPDEVVAVGAAIQAEGLTRGSDNLLLDVVPLSLGLETMGGLVEKIIHRNTPIPVAASQEFTTYQDGQDGMIIHVLQGEREMVEQNRSLARFELKDIPPLPAGIARIKVTFAVDADGLLSVRAREEITGKEQSVTVRPSYGLSEEEVERMLRESMEFAKEDITRRLLLEARAQAGRAMEEITSAFRQDGALLKAGERAAIERQMTVVREALAQDDRDHIDFERERLHALTAPFAERRMDSAIQAALKGAHVDEV